MVCAVVLSAGSSGETQPWQALVFAMSRVLVATQGSSRALWSGWPRQLLTFPCESCFRQTRAQPPQHLRPTRRVPQLGGDVCRFSQ